MALSPAFLAIQKAILQRKLEAYANAGDRPTENALPDERVAFKQRVLLPRILVALERIQMGAYGTCASCEEEIQQERLQAVPGAIYCVACQSRRDVRVV